MGAGRPAVTPASARSHRVTKASAPAATEHPTSTAASRSSSTRARWSVRRTPPPNTSATSFSSRSAAASPARSRTPSRPAIRQITRYERTVPRLARAPTRARCASCRLRPVGQARDRVGALAVAGDLAQATQLGAGRDALPLVATAGGRRPEEGRVGADAGREQHADGAAVAGVERGRGRARKAQRSERLGVEEVGGVDAARARKARGERHDGAAQGAVVAARVDDAAGGFLPVDLRQRHSFGRARRRGRGRGRTWPLRRSSGSAEPPSAQARQGLESSLSISYRLFAVGSSPVRAIRAGFSSGRRARHGRRGRLPAPTRPGFRAVASAASGTRRARTPTSASSEPANESRRPVGAATFAPAGPESRAHARASRYDGRTG